jgi:ubiquinone/menaquinone biosynthesis C-methylase UbiE
VEQATTEYYSVTRLHRTADHPVVQAFAKPKVAWIAQQIDLKDKRILEVGGGAGYFCQYLCKESADTHVLDISQEQLDLNPMAEDKKHCGTAYRLPFEDNSFDVVCASNLLHHLDNPLVRLTPPIPF